MPNAQILRDRVSVERATDTPDGMGGFDRAWAVAFERSGALSFASLTAQLETVSSGALDSKSRAVVTLRADPETETITAADRFVIAGDVWNVRGVAEFDRTGGFRRFIVERGVPA